MQSLIRSYYKSKYALCLSWGLFSRCAVTLVFLLLLVQTGHQVCHATRASFVLVPGSYLPGAMTLSMLLVAVQPNLYQYYHFFFQQLSSFACCVAL